MCTAFINVHSCVCIVDIQTCQMINDCSDFKCVFEYIGIGWYTNWKRAFCLMFAARRGIWGWKAVKVSPWYGISLLYYVCLLLSIWLNLESPAKGPTINYTCHKHTQVLRNGKWHRTKKTKYQLLRWLATTITWSEKKEDENCLVAYLVHSPHCHVYF